MPSNHDIYLWHILSRKLTAQIAAHNASFDQMDFRDGGTVFKLSVCILDMLEMLLVIYAACGCANYHIWRRLCSITLTIDITLGRNSLLDIWLAITLDVHSITFVVVITFGLLFITITVSIKFNIICYIWCCNKCLSLGRRVHFSNSVETSWARLVRHYWYHWSCGLMYPFYFFEVLPERAS